MEARLPNDNNNEKDKDKNKDKGNKKQTKDSDMIVIDTTEVRNIDVLFGRGGHTNNHPGNRLFRRLIRYNREAYIGTEDALTKQKLVKSIIAAIQRKGGRFLHAEDGAWALAPPKLAHRKTSQRFRDRPLQRGTSSSSQKLPDQHPSLDPIPMTAEYQNFPEVLGFLHTAAGGLQDSQAKNEAPRKQAAAQPGDMAKIFENDDAFGRGQKRKESPVQKALGTIKGQHTARMPAAGTSIGNTTAMAGSAHGQAVTAGQEPNFSFGMGTLSSDDNDKRIIQNKQQRLLLLYHSAKCQHGEGQCSVSPHCATAKNLWVHVERCEDDQCPVSHCFSSRDILSHYRQCNNPSCPSCVPVRSIIQNSLAETKPPAVQRPETVSEESKISSSFQLSRSNGRGAAARLPAELPRQVWQLPETRARTDYQGSGSTQGFAANVSRQLSGPEDNTSIGNQHVSSPSFLPIQGGSEDDGNLSDPLDLFLPELEEFLHRQRNSGNG